MKKKILIINTGGTISSVRTAQGFAPAQGHLAKTLPKILSLQHPEMPSYDIHEYEPLLDSSNMTLNEWNLGFAVIKVLKGGEFEVYNKSIIDGKVL